METIALFGAIFCVGSVSSMVTYVALTYIKYWCELREVSRYASRDYCMCGELVAGHGYGSGHAPVSEYDYHVSHVELVFK